MASAKNTKPQADEALLAVLTEPAVPVGEAAPPVSIEPGAVEIADAIIEEATPGERIKALIEALGHDIDKVASVEIRRPGIARILGTDRGLRSHRFEWPKIWERTE
ncbi:MULTISPECIES: hypothetical protein [unclassified Microbacterium]|uniref:hypothetical protein n=1 Tax=unclassified Microbacterium TaxID=2609290 RepID=UPI000EA8DADB|nr:MULTISPECIES: hypothetical protein [unclassified Microbacterium]MBT2484766.1 hypothetical protein [Microbacterium sp. ISL-108]RKN67642.1 hypothetical protein D7252_08640 [Microbacterium sp. CGR2]